MIHFLAPAGEFLGAPDPASAIALVEDYVTMKLGPEAAT